MKKLPITPAGHVENFTLVLAYKSLEKIDVITNVSNLIYKCKGNGANEFSCTIHKEFDGVVCRLWKQIKDAMLVYVKDTDEYFEIKVDLNTSSETIKNITATSLSEAELSQINIDNTEINTESDILREDYVLPTIFYDEDNPKRSLLHRLLEKAPHYKIGYVDISLWNIQKTFSFDGISIYDALTGDIAEEVKCIFIFNNNDRTIDVYDLLSYCYDCNERGTFEEVCDKCGSPNIKLGYGEDTGILIDKENYANEITISSNFDSYKNCFKLEGGDELFTATIKAINPNGSQYVYYFADEVLENMPSDLREKLSDYNELYSYYVNDCAIHFDENSTLLYNELVDKYNDDIYAKYQYNDNSEKVLTNNNFSKMNDIIGYDNIVLLYYDLIDFNLYLESSLLPTVIDEETSATKEITKLTTNSLSPIALQTISQTTSKETVESAIKNYVKVLISSGYGVSVTTRDYVFSNTVDEQGFSYGTWNGMITLNSYSDDTDTATTSNIKLIINENYAEFVNQKITKKLNEDIDTYGGILDIYKIEFTSADTDFKNALRFYSLNRLNSFLDGYQAVMDVLIELDQATSNADLYNDFYLPAYLRKKTIQKEVDLRISEIEIVDNAILIVQEKMDEIRSSLDMKQYLGEKLWITLNAYRREDTYGNSNYISDGLSNNELIKRVNEFIKVALNEIESAGTPQYTLSTTLDNLLLRKDFEPLRDSFELNNYIRLKDDGELFKLKLLLIEIDFENQGTIEVDFSTYKKLSSPIDQVKQVIDQAQSISTGFNYLQSQVKKNEKSGAIVDNWIENGFDATANKIVNSATNQNVVYDANGLLVRSHDDLTDAFSPEQLKLINSTLAITDNDWETVKAAIGKFHYKDPLTGELKTAYGVLADTIIGQLIIGEQLGIYNSNNTMTFDENGLVLKTIGDDGAVNNIFTIEKDGKKLFFIDEDGNIVMSSDAKFQYKSTSEDGEEIVQEGSFQNAIVELSKEGLRTTFEEINNKIDEVETSAYIFTIENDGDKIIDSSVQLSAKIHFKGLDVTTETDAGMFCWIRQSGDNQLDAEWNSKHMGKKMVSITSDDIDVSANFYCQITMPFGVRRTPSITIVDESDIAKLDNSYLDISGANSIQQYSDGTYSPDYTITPISITPCIMDNNVMIDLNKCEITFKRLQNGTEIPLGEGESVSNNVLIINKNLMDKEMTSLTYVCDVFYKNSFIKLFQSLLLNVDGENGTHGVGISSMTIYHTVSTSNTAPPTSGWTTGEVIRVKGQYLWEKIVTKFTNGETAESAPVCISGDDGLDGVGIVSITEYYALSSSNTVPPETWTENAPSLTEENGYLWNYTVIEYTDNSKKTTEKHVVGVHGNPGKGVSYVTNYYLATDTATGVTKDTLGWTDTVQNISNNKMYLWNYEVTTYTDGTTDSTEPCIIGTYGRDGTDGTSVTIKSKEITYQLGTSGTVTPTGTWSSSVPTLTQGKYLWTRTIITYSDGVSTTSYSISYIAIDGKPGDNGDDGIGVASISNKYAVSSSNTTAPATWKDNPPQMTVTNRYLWNYEIISYTNNTTSTTDPCVIGVYGDSGNDGKGISNIAEKYAVSSSSTTAPTTWYADMQVMTTTNKYLWNYEIITYTDGSKSETQKRVIGVYGNTGAAGKGISSITEYYAVSSSNTTAPATWSTSMVSTTTANKYLWNYEKITYTDGTSEDTIKRIIGTHGETGAAGKGISGITKYYLATSLSTGVTTSTSGWTTGIQTTTSTNKFLWSYEVITYTDSTKHMSTPVIIGTHGADGKDAAIKSDTPPDDTSKIWFDTQNDLFKVYNEETSEWETVNNPEEWKDRIDYVEKYANDQINDVKGMYTEISKTVSANYNNIASIQQNILDLQANTDGLSAELIKKIATTDDLDGYVKESELRAWINWGMDEEDHSVLTLGASKYSTKTRIRDDGMYIDVDNIESAHFTKNGLHTDIVEANLYKLLDGFEIGLDSSGNFVIR